MSGYLTQPELVEVRDAAIESGFGAAEMRQFLFAGILRSYESVLPRYAAPGLQVQSDLGQLNSVERLVDGSVPLEQWLRNATAQTLVAAPRAVFETAMDKVAASAAGEPEVSDGALPDRGRRGDHFSRRHGAVLISRRRDPSGCGGGPADGSAVRERRAARQ